MKQRPSLTKSISAKDFQEFYWLKAELLEFCREEGLPTEGGKREIAERIVAYVTTGNQSSTKPKKKQENKSTFDWSREILTADTILTNSYKNNTNVRGFFEQEIGERFRFNVPFMSWIKANLDKTLGQAITEWKRIEKEKKNNPQPKEIAPQFEYNRYLRDFLADNPSAKRETGIALWNIKKTRRGDNRYQKTDLDWIEKP